VESDPSANMLYDLHPPAGFKCLHRVLSPIAAIKETAVEYRSDSGDDEKLIWSHPPFETRYCPKISQFVSREESQSYTAWSDAKVCFVDYSTLAM